MKVGTAVVVVHVSPAVSMHIPAVEASIHETCQPPALQHAVPFIWAHLALITHVCSHTLHSSPVWSIYSCNIIFI